MKKGRISRRTALAATAMTVFATPAFASVIIQSYMSADITVGNECLVTVAGADVNSYTTSPDGPNVGLAAGVLTGARVSFERDSLTVRGMQGDRVIYNDVARLQNQCSVPLTVTLRMAGSQGSGWTDRYAEVYLSSTAAAIGSTAAFGYPTDSSGDWAANPLAVDGAGVIANAATSPVTVNAGSELRIAALIEAGTGSSLTDTSTMSWEVTAINSNGS